MLKLLKVVIPFCLLVFFLFSCHDNITDNDRVAELNNTVQLPEDHNFYSVEFIDDNTGWAVGRSGVIYKTTDRGGNWTAQNSGITEDLVKVKFFDNLNGWVAGVNDILSTTDGGETWHVKLSGQEFSVFVCMQFIDKNTGYISGTPDGKIYHTVDSGNNWEIQRVDTLGRIADLSFVDSNCGFSFNTISLYKTSNGGKSWTKIVSPRLCSCIKFIDTITGYAGNDIMPSSLSTDRTQIFKTTDGGQNWEGKNIPGFTGEVIWKIDFINSETGFAIAGGVSDFAEEPAGFVTCGKLIYTTNGNDWDLVAVNLPDKIVDFTFYGKNNITALTIDGKILFLKLK